MADNHGNTPAAWTAVVVGLVGFVVGGVGLMVDSMVTFWVGVGLVVPVSLVIGKIMQMMGMGSEHAEH